jgi:hypothetical protein
VGEKFKLSLLSAIENGEIDCVRGGVEVEIR